MGIFDFGKKKSKSVLGVDIGSSSIKIVQMRKENGAAVLETYGELALGPYAGVEIGQSTNLAAEKITESLKDLLREASATTTDAGVSIPFARSLLTLVELPRRENPEEQKTVIELEARKYIPVPVAEVQLDWFLIPEALSEGEKPSSKVKVLLVAVHNDQLNLLNSVITNAGLAATFYEIEIFSTIRSVVDEPVKPIFVLDIGASATKAYVIERGVVAVSHNIREGGQDVTRTISSAHNLPMEQAEQLKKEHGFGNGSAGYDRSTVELVFSRIFEEARKVVTQYQNVHNVGIETLVLTGGGGITKDLVAYAQSFFSMEVKVANPFSHANAPAFMRPTLEEIGPEFAVAVGLALRKLEELG